MIQYINNAFIIIKIIVIILIIKNAHYYYGEILWFVTTETITFKIIRFIIRFKLINNTCNILIINKLYHIIMNVSSLIQSHLNMFCS